MTTEVSRRTALGLLGAAAAVGATTRVASASAPDGPPDVQLLDNGSTVTLSNGIVSATVVKATAQITTLQLVGSAYGNGMFNLVGGNHGQAQDNTTRHSDSSAGTATTSPFALGAISRR